MDDWEFWLFLGLAAAAGVALYLAVGEMGRGIIAGMAEYRARASQPGQRGDAGQEQAGQGPHAGADRGSAEPPPRPWHVVLRVAPTAPLDAIKQAYRREIALYHPDRVAGLADELQAIAEQRAKEINAAYQTGCRLHGAR